MPAAPLTQVLKPVPLPLPLAHPSYSICHQLPLPQQTIMQKDASPAVHLPDDLFLVQSILVSLVVQSDDKRIREAEELKKRKAENQKAMKIAKAAKAAAAQLAPRRKTRKGGQHTDGAYREADEKTAQSPTDQVSEEDEAEEA